MKKISILFTLLFIGFVAVFTSCQKDSAQPGAGMTMYYLGASRDYSVRATMSLFPDSNFIQIYGAEYGTINYTDLEAHGQDTGTFYMSDTSIINYIRILKGYVKYSTQRHGGWGVFTITKLDTGLLGAKGTFRGTVVNLINPSDSFSVTQGSFYLPCYYHPH